MKFNIIKVKETTNMKKLKVKMEVQPYEIMSTMGK